MQSDAIRYCARCSTAYTWRTSHSTLKMTYCGIMCEHAALGFTIESLLTAQRAPRLPDGKSIAIAIANELIVHA